MKNEMNMRHPALFISYVMPALVEEKKTTEAHYVFRGEVHRLINKKGEVGFPSAWHSSHPGGKFESVLSSLLSCCQVRSSHLAPLQPTMLEWENFWGFRVGGGDRRRGGGGIHKFFFYHKFLITCRPCIGTGTAGKYSLISLPYATYVQQGCSL